MIKTLKMVYVRIGKNKLFYNKRNKVKGKPLITASKLLLCNTVMSLKSVVIIITEKAITINIFDLY